MWYHRSTALCKHCNVYSEIMTLFLYCDLLACSPVFSGADLCKDFLLAFFTQFDDDIQLYHNKTWWHTHTQNWWHFSRDRSLPRHIKWCIKAQANKMSVMWCNAHTHTHTHTHTRNTCLPNLNLNRFNTNSRKNINLAAIKASILHLSSFIQHPNTFLSQIKSIYRFAAFNSVWCPSCFSHHHRRHWKIVWLHLVVPPHYLYF